MNVIVKLHGTSGSGKTTVARGLMETGRTETILNSANRKPEAYKTIVPFLKEPLYVLGPYTATCGGLDSLSDVEDHIRLLNTYGQLGHVFYEGLLGSEYYGRIGAVSEAFGRRHVFAFLDTPIELCLERIKTRREARGNTKPLNPTNTVGRVAKIERLKHRLLDMGREVEVIDHRYPVDHILTIYKNYDAQP